MWCSIISTCLLEGVSETWHRREFIQVWKGNKCVMRQTIFIRLLPITPEKQLMWRSFFFSNQVPVSWALVTQSGWFTPLSYWPLHHTFLHAQCVCFWLPAGNPDYSPGQTFGLTLGHFSSFGFLLRARFSLKFSLRLSVQCADGPPPMREPLNLYPSACCLGTNIFNLLFVLHAHTHSAVICGKRAFDAAAVYVQHHGMLIHSR